MNARRIGFVKPADPSEAFLVHNPPITQFLIGALLFVGGCYLVYYSSASRSITTPAPQQSRPSTLILIAVVCLVLFYAMLVRPLGRLIAVQHWTPTSATILVGEIRTCLLRVNHCEFYWADVAYEYRIGGRDYRSNTYNPTDLPSPWYYGKRSIVRRYPPGSTVTCFVNPADPSDAILTRHPSPMLWFGLVPLMGAGMALFDLVRERLASRLESVSPRLWKTLTLYLFAGLFTQLLLVIGNDLLNDWRAGTAEWPEIAMVFGVGCFDLSLIILATQAWRSAPRAEEWEAEPEEVP